MIARFLGTLLLFVFGCKQDQVDEIVLPEVQFADVLDEESSLWYTGHRCQRNPLVLELGRDVAKIGDETYPTEPVWWLLRPLYDARDSHKQARDRCHGIGSEDPFLLVRARSDATIQDLAAIGVATRTVGVKWGVQVERQAQPPRRWHAIVQETPGLPTAILETSGDLEVNTSWSKLVPSNFMLMGVPELTVDQVVAAASRLLQEGAACVSGPAVLKSDGHRRYLASEGSGTTRLATPPTSWGRKGGSSPIHLIQFHDPFVKPRDARFIIDLRPNDDRPGEFGLYFEPTLGDTPCPIGL